MDGKDFNMERLGIIVQMSMLFSLMFSTCDNREIKHKDWWGIVKALFLLNMVDYLLLKRKSIRYVPMHFLPLDASRNPVEHEHW